MLPKVRIYTDGSCFKNPGGVGGWGAVILHPDGFIDEVSGGVGSTTSNRMVHFEWVKAHNDDEYNELADMLAGAAAASFRDDC